MRLSLKVLAFSIATLTSAHNMAADNVPAECISKLKNMKLSNKVTYVKPAPGKLRIQVDTKWCEIKTGSSNGYDEYSYFHVPLYWKQDAELPGALKLEKSFEKEISNFQSNGDFFSLLSHFYNNLPIGGAYHHIVTLLKGVGIVDPFVNTDAVKVKLRERLLSVLLIEYTKNLVMKGKTLKEMVNSRNNLIYNRAFKERRLMANIYYALRKSKDMGYLRQGVDIEQAFQEFIQAFDNNPNYQSRKKALEAALDKYFDNKVI